MAEQTYKVRDPSGAIREIKGPAGASDEEVIAQAKKLLSGPAAAPASLVAQIPGGENAPAPVPETPSETPVLDAIRAPGEVALSLGAGAVSGLAGNVRGLAHGLVNGLGTQEGGREAADLARGVAEAGTYQPRTAMGKDWLGRLGKVAEALPPQGLAPVLSGAGGAVGTAGRTAAAKVAPKVDRALERSGAMLDAKPAELAGVGAAETSPSRIRQERAASFPIPVKLTKGQGERSFEQQRFERETAKAGDIGAPLRERYADQNAAILGNFDAWVDQTGAQAGSLRAVGQAVDKALVEKAKKAKGEIRAAYNAAEKAGDMAERVATSPIAAYLEQHRPEAVNAGILTSAEQKLKQLAGKDGAISINDLEELRKMVGNLSGKDATNAHFGKELKQVIDGLTEGKGGEAYKKARALRSRYAREFEDVGVIDRMLSTKPGTSDRAVAFEDVFNHSILNGSLDDVRAVRKTLQTAGPEGAQAWKELQGQTVNHLKELATGSATTDIKGNRIVSAQKLDKAIRDLDRDGKLDFIFGKQGAQQMRDIADLAADVHTAPPGVVNTSNTGAVMLEALSNFAVGKLPTAGAKGLAAAKDFLGKRKLRKQVQEALNPNGL